MRTITFLTLLVSLIASSKATASELYLRIAGQGESTLSLDNYQYFSNTGSFFIGEVYPGQHSLLITQTVYRGNGHGNGRGKGNGHGKGKGHHGHEQNHQSYEQVLYHGPLFIAPHSRIFATLTPRGQLIIDRTEPIGRRAPMRPRSPQGPRGPRYGSGSYPGSGFPTYGSGSSGPTYSNSGISRVLDMIERESFESNKLTLAKQYVESNEVSSQDVYLLMKSMDFESSRLTLAKFAYDYVYDPENFYVVNSAFEFSSSVAALAKHIG